MNISDLQGNKEVSLLKKKLEQSYRASKAIYKYYDYLYEIKQFIADEDLQSASGYWNDLDYDIQRLLYAAPRYGGIFTTKEREIVKGFWVISVNDIDGER